MVKSVSEIIYNKYVPDVSVAITDLLLKTFFSLPLKGYKFVNEQKQPGSQDLSLNVCPETNGEVLGTRLEFKACIISSPNIFSEFESTRDIRTLRRTLSFVILQPYAHTGIYSEGEFAVSPTVVQLAAERNLPIGGDWDTTVLGRDQGE